MDWLAQLDNLTKFLAFVFVVLAGANYCWWLAVQDKDIQIRQLQRDLKIVTGERDKLLGAVDEVIAAVDEQDRASGSPWGPAREKIEALRREVT